MGDGDKPRPGIQELFVFLQHDLPPVVDRRHSQPGALLFAKDLPRYDIGMMLHVRNNDLVSRLDMLFPVSIRDEVDAFGSPADENDFSGVRRVDETLDLRAGVFVLPRGSLAERMNAAVDVGAVQL